LDFPWLSAEILPTTVWFISCSDFLYFHEGIFERLFSPSSFIPRFFFPGFPLNFLAGLFLLLPEPCLFFIKSSPGAT